MVRARHRCRSAPCSKPTTSRCSAPRRSPPAIAAARMSFAGGAYTDSYDSTVANSWNKPSLSDGNVGTNGNLTGGQQLHNQRGAVHAAFGRRQLRRRHVTAADAGAAITAESPLSQPVNFRHRRRRDPLPPTTARISRRTPDVRPVCPRCTRTRLGQRFIRPSAATVVTLGNVHMNARRGDTPECRHLCGEQPASSMAARRSSSIAAGPSVKVAGVDEHFRSIRSAASRVQPELFTRMRAVRSTAATGR